MGEEIQPEEIELRSESTILEQIESARETATELDEDGDALDALAAMIVEHTLLWTLGVGEEDLDDQLLKIKDE